MHSLHSLLSLWQRQYSNEIFVKNLKIKKPTIRERPIPGGLVSGNQMPTDGQRLVKTGTNWTDIQTSRPASLFSTERIRQTDILSSKHDAFDSLRF